MVEKEGQSSGEGWIEFGVLGVSVGVWILQWWEGGGRVGVFWLDDTPLMAFCIWHFTLTQRSELVSTLRLFHGEPHLSRSATFLKCR